MSSLLWLGLVAGAVVVGLIVIRWARRRSPAQETLEVPGLAGLRRPRQLGATSGRLAAGVPVVPSTWLQLPLLAPGELQEVVGESAHQDALLVAAREKTEAGTAVRVVTAQLRLEDDNPYDPEAVGVFVGGHKVGYLAAEDTGLFREMLAEVVPGGEPLSCRAWLTGGWKRPGGDEGSIGLELDLELPLRRTCPEDPFLPRGGAVEVDGVEAHAELVERLAAGAGAGPIATLVEVRRPAGSVLQVWMGGEAVGVLPPPETAAYLPVVREVAGAGLPATCEAEIIPAPGAPRVELSLAPAEELTSRLGGRLASRA